MNTKRNTLKTTTSALLLGLGLLDSACAELSSSIPASALSSNGRKVTICHFPPGNPTNYQVITISTSALNTHITHHDDVYANGGQCPVITSGITWQYAGAYNASTGAPNSMSDLSSTMPSDLVSKVLTKLPEGRGINSNAQSQALLTDDLGANISLKQNANVKVSFVAEGAGYKNAISYFNFNSTDLNTLAMGQVQDKVIFPNFSAVNSGGVMKYGDTVDLGQISANTSIGFTVIANGWNSTLGKVNPNQSASNIFRTIKRLNPEPDTENRRAHTVLLSDPQSGLLVLGIEDLNRSPNSGSDDDFNDAIIAIHVDPFSAVDLTHVNSLTASSTPPAHGESGPISWREVTTPPAVEDPIKAAKTAARAAQNAARNKTTTP